MKVYSGKKYNCSSNMVVRPTMGKFAVFQMCGKDKADILFKGTEDECYEWIENNKNNKKSVKASVDEDDRYELIERKSIRDSDGFMTEYSMYFDHEEGRYVFVYGDSDIYYPEDEDFDYECEDINEAYEWFESYNGFEDPAELEIGSIVSADGLVLKFMGQSGDMYKFKPMDDRTRNLLMEVDERYDPDDDCIYLDIEDVESSIYW